MLKYIELVFPLVILQTGLTKSMGIKKPHQLLKNYIDKKAIVKDANRRGLNLFKESK